QRVVDGAVTVRVVLAHDVADHPGALEVPAVGPVPAVVHRPQDAGMDRLEAVPHVGQGTADDDRHRVVDVAALHLDLDVDWLGPVPSAWRGARVHVGHLLAFLMSLLANGWRPAGSGPGAGRTGVHG